VRSLTLSAAKVFVPQDLFELIDRIIEMRMPLLDPDHGTLVTEKTLSFSRKKSAYKVELHPGSIDGSCSEIHDKSRGKGSFKLRSWVALAEGVQIPVTTRVTVNRHNVDDLDNIAGLLLNDIGLLASAPMTLCHGGRMRKTKPALCYFPSNK